MTYTVEFLKPDDSAGAPSVVHRIEGEFATYGQARTRATTLLLIAEANYGATGYRIVEGGERVVTTVGFAGGAPAGPFRSPGGSRPRRCGDATA